MLAFWKADDTFLASVERNPAGENGANEFVFYDGPPFANGLPHYGHLLTGYVKDVVPRYQTMRGRRVERRFGWDSHGLPAEVEAKSQLGLKTKSEIVEMGIEAFNDACRNSVLRYTHEWQDYVTRQARWVDFDNDYKTLDLDYMETVMWAFKTLWDKGLIYEGYGCCGTARAARRRCPPRDADGRRLYRSRQDPAVTVGLPAGDRRAGADLDDHAVDAAVQPGDRGRPRRRLRRGASRAEHVRRRALPAGRRAAAALRPRARRGRRGAGRPPAEGLRAGRPALHPAVRLLPRQRRTRTGSWPPTTSPPRTAPGRCTSRRPSARRTRSSPTPPASTVVTRRRGRASSPPRCRLRGHARVRREQPHHRRPQGARRACCCAGRPTSTRTRTAGAATTR